MACLLGLPAFAVDIEKEPAPDFLWELDFNKMSSINDNMGNPQYTIDGNNVVLGEIHGKKALAEWRMVLSSCFNRKEDVVERNCRELLPRTRPI